MNPVLRKEKGSSTAWEVDLEKQMQAWTENPSWVDQSPKIKVRVKQQKCSSWFSNELWQIGSSWDSSRRFCNRQVLTWLILVATLVHSVMPVHKSSSTWKFLRGMKIWCKLRLVLVAPEAIGISCPRSNTGFVEKNTGVILLMVNVQTIAYVARIILQSW